MSTSLWSQSLRSQTLDCIENARVNPLDGNLHFKCTDGRRACISINDLLARKMHLNIKGSDEQLNYNTPDDLIGSGWAID